MLPHGSIIAVCLRNVKHNFAFCLRFLVVVNMVQKIKELCKNQNISIAKLERMAGLGNGTIGKWEKFSRKPKHEHLKSIADILSVSISDLTGEEAQKEKPPAQGGKLTEEQRELIRLYDSVPAEIQAAALAVLKSAEVAHKVQGEEAEEK